MNIPRQKIAVVGAGISGMLTARLLSDEHDVELFEAENRLGGHTCTVQVENSGRTHPLDTGFMVFNEVTYPNFVRMLRWLEIPWRDSDMSFSVRCDRTGLEYAGNNLNSLFAQRSNLFRPGFWRMLLDVPRFNSLAVRLLDEGLDDVTLGEFLTKHKFSIEFTGQYLLPMGAAIWSMPPLEMRQFPARLFLQFFRNHGLLSIAPAIRWKTIPGGAVRYIEKLLAPLQGRIHRGCPVTAVRRNAGGVLLKTADGQPHVFDAVVLASHADQSLQLLQDASGAERQVLSAFPYQPNEAVLHTDRSLLPRSTRAWASWNYHVAKDPAKPAAVTYDLNRLQGIDSAEHFCVTLNRTDQIDPARILRTMQFEHPVFSSASVAAQGRWSEINGVNRTYYCGAYWGHGFHEDGVNSALAVARMFGKDLPACTAPSTKGMSSIAGSAPHATSFATAST